MKVRVHIQRAFRARLKILPLRTGADVPSLDEGVGIFKQAIRPAEGPCGINDIRGLIILCAVGKRRDSGEVARAKAVTVGFATTLNSQPLLMFARSSFGEVILF